MNDQEAFDTVVQHFARQGHQSLLDNNCVYRGVGGDKCAIGALIPDELYRPGMENTSVDTLMSRYPSVGKHLEGASLYLLSRLQVVHDDSSKWIDSITMRATLKTVAHDFGLSDRVVDEYDWSDWSELLPPECDWSELLPPE